METAASSGEKQKITNALSPLQPGMRAEYMGALTRSFPAIDVQSLEFDNIGAPHVEKRGIEAARIVASGVLPEDFPDPAVYLISVLNRLEAFRYEIIHDALSQECTNCAPFIYALGIRKCIDAVAAILQPEQAEVWDCRRNLLDDIESRMCQTAGSPAECDFRRYEILISLNALEISQMKSAAELLAKAAMISR